MKNKSPIFYDSLFKHWKKVFACILLLATVFLYFAHYKFFHDLHHILIYLVGDIAFLPLEILVVTLIIHRLIDHHEKKRMLSKLNMVIGVFFSVTGTELLRFFAEHDQNIRGIRSSLAIQSSWTKKEFQKAESEILNFNVSVWLQEKDFNELKSLLVAKRDFLTSLLENQNLLEHESFTDLLWAVFHLLEELSYRVNFKKLPKTDYQHLMGDINRAYSFVALEWLQYIRHLQGSYPYLFSLAMRTNPFAEKVSVAVT